MLCYEREMDASKDHRFSFANATVGKVGDSGYGRTQPVMANRDFYKRSHDLGIRTLPKNELSGNYYGKEIQWVAKGQMKDDDPSVHCLPFAKVSSPVDRSKGEICQELDHSHHDNKSMRPHTKSERIARYRKEMMELVRDVPEYANELSLRDIVELPRSIEVQNKILEGGEQQEEEKEKQKKGKRHLFRNDIVQPRSPIMLNMFISTRFSKMKSGKIGRKQSSKPVDVKCEVEKGSESESGRKSRSTTKSSKKITGCFPLISFITNRSRQKRHKKPQG